MNYPVNYNQSNEGWEQIKQDIFEGYHDWKKSFHEGWLAHYKHFGVIDWNKYHRPENHNPISGKGIELASSRLMLISSAGGYLNEIQQSFDVENPIGDYSIRVFSSDTPFSNLEYSHDHYDHTAVNNDPQVLLPLAYLQEMVNERKIGELTNVVSFMGYHPDVSRVVDETIPAIIDVVKQEAVDAAFLVPS